MSDRERRARVARAIMNHCVGDVPALWEVPQHVAEQVGVDAATAEREAMRVMRSLIHHGLATLVLQEFTPEFVEKPIPSEQLEDVLAHVAFWRFDAEAERQAAVVATELGDERYYQGDAAVWPV